MYRLLLFSLSNLSMSYASSLSFYFSAVSAILCHFKISFLLTPASRGTSVMSLHILILPYTGCRYSLFQSFFLGSPFWSSVGPF